MWSQLRDLGVDLTREARALDIGCGAGVLRGQVEARSAWVVDGADLNPAALERMPPGRGERLCYDVTEPCGEFLHRYDYVLLYDVLEHLESTAALLTAAAAHLLDGGLVLVNVPALPTAFGEYDRVTGHLRRYTPSTLRKALEAASLDVVDIRYWGCGIIPLAYARNWVVRPGLQPRDAVRRGMVPPAAWMNHVLTWIAGMETRVFPRPPLGTSLLAAARKRS